MPEQFFSDDTLHFLMHSAAIERYRKRVEAQFYTVLDQYAREISDVMAKRLHRTVTVHLSGHMHEGAVDESV